VDALAAPTDLILRPTISAVDRDELVLRATLEFGDRSRSPFELRIGVPAELAERADRSANPFIPLATLLAARLAEDLTIEGPVSPRLLAGAGRAAATFQEWWGYRPPELRAEGGEEPARGGDGVGVMFTRGVDSGATLIRSLRGEIPERVTHLLSGDGIEWAYSPEVEREIWADHERAAAELGLPLIRMTCNARELLRGLIGWPRSFGAAYIGSALAVGPMLANVLTGATQPLVDPEPRGSRFDLDPLWSTEGTAVRQDGAELDRMQRTAIVASDVTYVRWLKVCWQGRGPGNCGRCMKCLRTMTALAGVGVLEQSRLFEAPLTAEAIRDVKPEKLGVALSDAIPRSVPASMPEIRAAWERKVAEDRAARLARDRAAASASRSAPGSASRRLRRARRRLARRARRALRRARRGAGRILGRG
jgi:hypothetical protein